MAKKKKAEPGAAAADAAPVVKPAPVLAPAPPQAPALAPAQPQATEPALPSDRPAAAAPPATKLAPDARVALAPDVSLEGSANAPFIYFENAGVSGHMNGMVRVTLEANRLLPGENSKVYVDRVIVGHLRMNIPAAQALRAALDRALLLASPPLSREVN